nr:protein phosphatase 2C domain-containing protein [Chromatium okenii]
MRGARITAAVNPIKTRRGASSWRGRRKCSRWRMGTAAKSFRSQCGARLAVLAAQQVCKHLVEFEHLSQCKHWAEEQLPVAVVRQWQERVERRLARQPFTAAELAPLNDAARRQLENQPLIAYGSTLLAVIVAPKFILYLQLGDGDLLTMTTKETSCAHLLKMRD